MLQCPIMYLPISRKYRPQVFDKIVGQEHITKTLTNAIDMGKVAHAYLFSGSRGVGKTSTARVFAKALNCQKGPTSTPCNKCTSCLEIAKGISLDVMEIDGASNRGIDEIRNLRENVKLMPVSGKYRIYIIDEVHMLTQEAFNALLKTLEEPPRHVKFIFATTRPYKILPTILSRCQRFDFRTIPVETIIEILKNIAKTEQIHLEDDALFLIAKNANGSMRDAQVMLDQIASYSKGKIKGQDVSSMLGTLEQDVLTAISEAILNNDNAGILSLVDEMITGGKDAFFIASSLIEHFRNIMIIASCEDGSRHVIKFSMEELFYIVFTLSKTLDLIQKTSLGRIPLEMALLKLSRKEKLIPIAELLERITKIENSIKKNREPIYNSSPVRQKAALNNQTSNDIPSQNNSEDINYEEPPLPETYQEDQVPVPGEGISTVDAQFQRLKGIWPEIVRAVKNRKVSAGVYLEEGYLLNLDENKVIIGFSRNNTLHKESLETAQNVDVITNVIKDFMEKELKPQFVFSDSMEDKKNGGGSATGNGNQTAPQSKRMEPIIRSAIDKFGGRIVRQYYVKG